MRAGTILDIDNFIVIEPLYYHISSYNITIPYIYGIGDSKKDFTYVRKYSDLVNYINELLLQKTKAFVYCYNLTPLGLALSDSFELNKLVKQRDAYIKFNIEGLKFRAISPLTCDASLSSFAGVEFKNMECYPDVNLKSKGYNWIVSYLEKLLTADVEFVEKIISLNPSNPPLTRAKYTKYLLSQSCQGGTYTELRNKFKSGDESAFEKLNMYRNTYFGFKGCYNNIINESHYDFLKSASRGGCICYNIDYKNKVVKNVSHKDICSSYIAQMFLRKFPMKRVSQAVDIEDIKLFASDGNGGELWVVMELILYDVKSVSSFKPLSYDNDMYWYCTPIGNIDDGDFELADNKFIERADSLKIQCTLDELRYLSKFYDFENFQILYAESYTKDYLPKEYLGVVMDMFYQKSDAKESNAPEWLISFIKAGLNSSWGFQWSGFYDKNIEYDIKHYNYFSSVFEDRTWSYMWGIAVTAYAREALYRAADICGDNWLYSDTDSVFYISSNEIERNFRLLNEYIEEDMLKCPNSRYFKFEYGKYSLGRWDDECDLDYFIYFTCKQYLGYGKEGFKSAFSGLTCLDVVGWQTSLLLNIDEFFEMLEGNRCKIPVEFGYVPTVIEHKSGTIKLNNKVYSYPSGLCINKRSFAIGVEFII